MVDVVSVPLPSLSPQPHHHQHKTNITMLYYGIVVVITTAIILAGYNLIIIKWCSIRQVRSGQNRSVQLQRSGIATSSEQSSRNFLLSSFKYKKGINLNLGSNDQGNEYECAVCLSVFEEGEEVRQLPRCKHSFHADCIDMWLYSHSDCPLCRSRIDCSPTFCCQRSADANIPGNHSREGLRESGNTNV